MPDCRCTAGLISFLATQRDRKAPEPTRCFVCNDETAPVAALTVAVKCLHTTTGLDTVSVPVCTKDACAMRVCALSAQFADGGGALLVGAQQTANPREWPRGESARRQLSTAAAELTKRVVFGPRRCAQCGLYEWKRDGDSEWRVKILACGRCGSATYCGSECQRLAWRVHKMHCAQ